MASITKEEYLENNTGLEPELRKMIIQLQEMIYPNLEEQYLSAFRNYTFNQLIVSNKWFPMHYPMADVVKVFIKHLGDRHDIEDAEDLKYHFVYLTTKTEEFLREVADLRPDFYD